ncbi:hypothetical protein N0V88_007023 [Collariella sp. IMI 366227]|nr:hypothetical protein N0V88_007023 [Collariella sp. IMI 366227]
MAPITMSLYSTLVFAAAASARVMHELAAVPAGWEHRHAASPDDTVFLRVALKHNPGIDSALDQAVLDMSTPGHPNYGLHMTRDELRSFTAPSDAAVTTVTDWLLRYGIQPTVDHDWISFTTGVETANKLLDTDVPDHIAAHVDLVQPTTRFGHLAARKSAIFDLHRFVEDYEDAISSEKDTAVAADSTAPAECGLLVRPDCLKSLYNINYTAMRADNKVAFASFLEEYARYDDLKEFTEKYLPDSDLAAATFSVELINGGLDDQSSSSDASEANLDAQYLYSISHPIPMVEYSTAGRGPLVPTASQPTPPGSNEPYLEFLLYMASLPDSALPQTLSTSYGEEEQSVPREYALKVCDMFKELGARGVSVLFASGDSGPGNLCIRNTDNATFFESNFPRRFGGFSIYHDQPIWQKDAVETYLASINDTYAPFFNRTGRGFPDVSAQAMGFVVRNTGAWITIGGTSASSPVVAGVVGLLNAARKAQGQPPMGFLNPWLYNNSAAFKDMVNGSSFGCAGREELGRHGARWNATPGWDPVTGLGTPLFERLLEAAAPGTKNE